MVQLNLRLTAKSGRATELIEALQSHMRRTRGLSGCTGATLAADVDAPDTFAYHEDWKDQQRLEEQLRTDHFSQLLELMETSDSVPVLEFRIISESRGLEYVTAVRDSQRTETTNTPDSSLEKLHRGGGGRSNDRSFSDATSQPTPSKAST